MLNMFNKKKIYAIILVMGITIAIVVPVLLLTGGRPADNTPPTIQILSPTNTTYISQTTQVTIDITSSDLNIDTIWYRVFNETAGTWVDPVNVTWTATIQKTIGKGVYTIYVWANDSYGRTSTMASETFTMIHEIQYSGDTVFPVGLTVGVYEKVVFRDGIFILTSGSLDIYGLFEMDNVSFADLVYTYAFSIASIHNSSIGGFRTYGNSTLTVEGATVTSLANWVNDNSTVNLTNSAVASSIFVYDFGKLSGMNVSLFHLYLYQNSEGNLSYGSLNSYSYVRNDAVLSLTNFTSYNFIRVEDQGIATFRNHTTNSPLYVIENATLTLINSKVLELTSSSFLNSGNLTVTDKVISGTGEAQTPTLTLVNTTYSMIFEEYTVIGTTNAFFQDTAVWEIIVDNQANVTIYNCTPFQVTSRQDSIVNIVNSSMVVLDIAGNSTVLIDNSTVTSFIEITFAFTKGTIYGYNTTFVGAEGGNYPNFTLGSNVNYNDLRYSYDVLNQVQFTLVNTTSCQRIYGYDSSNLTLHFCDVLYSYEWGDANITIHNSTFNRLYAMGDNNITLFNSTISNFLQLESTSYAFIAQVSYVNELRLRDSSGFYLAPDSSIGGFG